ncbi:MAG: AMMECR1 domain-containing protein [Armatimonadia bacterium]|nr:AMMECR1 domain-containing protein [Armatimonadia bacterium]
MALVGLTVLPAAGAESVAERFAADPVAAQAALELARESVDAWVLRHERAAVRDDLPPLLYERAGVFVSAMLGDAPRCCMGTLYPTKPTLAEQILDGARAAAGMDLRFPPITPDELPRIRVIVSVLEPPLPIQHARGLDPAREGLAVRGANGWGVVLPRETPRAELIEPWARIRAGVTSDEPVDYYRVRAFRIVEPKREL